MTFPRARPPLHGRIGVPLVCQWISAAGLSLSRPPLVHVRRPPQRACIGRIVGTRPRAATTSPDDNFGRHEEIRSLLDELPGNRARLTGVEPSLHRAERCLPFELRTNRLGVPSWRMLLLELYHGFSYHVPRDADLITMTIALCRWLARILKRRLSACTSLTSPRSRASAFFEIKPNLVR